VNLSKGQHIGPYEIVAPLGEGGMGHVYRAHDARLGRDVALKVLPADVAADPERLARFRREARAVAALNHPHIVTIFSIEEEHGMPFMTMELVEGRSLDQALTGGGFGQSYVPATALIIPADAAGHRDLSIQYAERAWAEREPMFILLARHHPEWRSIRSDPRFQAILREMDAPAEMRS
jgi:hypothetical protein